MAINTYQIPKYEYYDGEASYVSPAEVSNESLSRIKKRKIGAKVSDVLFGELA